MSKSDEERYAEYFNQEEETSPLDEVKNIRTEQLTACDFKQHREMAKMIKALEEKSKES